MISAINSNKGRKLHANNKLEYKLQLEKRKEKIYHQNRKKLSHERKDAPKFPAGQLNVAK